MELGTDWQGPALGAAIGLLAGVVGLVIARHLRVPAIVVLLAMGVALGPDALGLIEPARLGRGLLTLVGLAVAVILFDGGLNLNLRRLLREERAIRQLVTVGALVTAAAAALAARLCMGWRWDVAILFGTLVIVTGPTVITPLLKRLRVQRRVATILEAEGVLIDPIGAIIAIAALEVVISPGREGLDMALVRVGTTLGLGMLVGAVSGLALAGLLHVPRLVPDGLKNILSLAFVFATFEVAEALLPECGIAAVTVAGVVVGNVGSAADRQLLDFKGQLTNMLIGLLFILLSADVRLSTVASLGPAALLLVALLMLAVRPLDVAISTWRTDLSLKQRAFIAWIGPRGIVAAAVASYFAVHLEAQGIAGGEQLRAAVFLVITVTVVFASLTGGLMASILGLRRKFDHGWAILGANELGRTLAQVLSQPGEEATCIDSNPEACEAAQDEGLRVVYGDALSERTLQRAEIDTRAGAVGVAPNDALNLLFLRHAKQEGPPQRLYGVIGKRNPELDQELLAREGGLVLFGAPTDVDLWSVRIRRGIAALEYFELKDPPESRISFAEAPQGALLPLALRRKARFEPYSSSSRPERGSVLAVLINVERRQAAAQWLAEQGWSPTTRKMEERQRTGV